MGGRQAEAPGVATGEEADRAPGQVVRAAGPPPSEGPATAPEGSPPLREDAERPAPGSPLAAAPLPAAAAVAAMFPSLEGRGAAADMALLLDVPLLVTVELGRTQCLVRDILALAPGAVLALERLAGEPVDVLVNGRRIARGEVVVVDESFGVRVTEIPAADEGRAR